MPSTSAPPVSSGLGPVLFECARLLDDIAQAEVNRQAGRPVLTPALVRLLPHLSTRGIRPTELARRVDVSKQAVGQALADLEGRGFVEQVPDPADGRARLVRLTPSGLAAFDDGRRVLAFFEAALADRVGHGVVEALNGALHRVHAVLAEWTTSGAPRSPRRAASRPAPPRATGSRPRR